MKDFKNLQIWKLSHALVLELYNYTNKFPKEEIYGLTSQIRRAGVSIPTNIAEGCGRGSDQDFARFLQISVGSASEVEYLLLLSQNLNYISNEAYNLLQTEITKLKKMTISLIKKIKSNSKSLNA